jgi:hypothetical protein
MKARVSFTYGQTNYLFEFDEAGEKETLLKTIVLGNPPRSCPLIKDQGAIYKLEAKEVSGKHIYIEAVCIGVVDGHLVVAKSQLGTYESTKGYFWKPWEIDEFATTRIREALANKQSAQGGETQTPTTARPAANTKVSAKPALTPPEIEEEDDLPF